MAEKKVKVNALGIPETKVLVNLKGVVKLPKDPYEEGVGKSGKPFRKFRFGIETEKDNIVQLEIFAMQNDAYAYSKAEGKTEKVPFNKIATFKKEGYEIIGTRVKLNGEDKNLIGWDMTEYLSKTLTEGKSIFTNAEIEFRKYEGENGVKIQKTITPKAIYESSKAVDFETELGQNVMNFDMIYMGIEKDTDGGKYDVEAKYVAYKDIVDVLFVVRDDNLAKAFKTKLKPYTTVTVSGKVINKAETVEEKVEDGWGSFESVRNVKSYTTEILIEGANPATIDKDKYSEKVIDEALSKKTEFDANKDKGNDDFGAFTKTTDEEDDPFAN